MGASLALLAVTLTAIPAQAEPDSLDALKQMSLEQLADLEISILSKRPERLADTPAAVHVITGDDILRSGYTSIAEALRMVPGLNVARIDTAEWAISSRGFNSRFANKLLVLMDGRSVYSPLFAGVFWEAIDTMLEDIERIEVIRGPGASIWGANAVNGVINIITKKATETQGTLVSGYAGNAQRGLAARLGGKLGETGHLRLYAKYNDRDAAPKLDGSAGDDPSEGGRAGFRSDWNLADDQQLTVQGDIFKEDPDTPLLQGANLLMRWEKTAEDGATNTFQAYYDYFSLDSNEPLREKLDTIDLEFRHQFARLGSHSLIAGMGYRWRYSDIRLQAPSYADEEDRDYHLWSAFIQDDIELREYLHLTLGTKLEHNDFSGFEVQPTARIRWNPSHNATLWGSVSRAVRVPTRVEHDLFLEDELANASPETLGLPLVARSQPNDGFASEELIAYELGYRWSASQSLALDATAFYNDYDKLRTLELDSPKLGTDPFRIILPVTAENNMRGNTYGTEWLLDWRPRNDMSFQATYAYLRMHLDPHEGSTDPTADGIAGQAPRHQAGLRAAIDLSHDLELDLFGRYVSKLSDFEVDAYTELDARLGWRMNSHVSFALVGRNLLNPRHQEFGSEDLGAPPKLIEREVFLRMYLNF